MTQLFLIIAQLVLSYVLFGFLSCLLHLKLPYLYRAWYFVFVVLLLSTTYNTVLCLLICGFACCLNEEWFWIFRSTVVVVVLVRRGSV